ncbi:MAG: flagellar biosynthesis protein FliQ [Gammaproteobacteria bacterium]|jgi:flagellar biosynthetic protein FliQ|nr:MAG: flagellar biosynthesis protein FliQ [Gammaproteobacteria bacterium]
MTPETVMTLGQQALTVTTLLAAPLLLSALVAGVVIGMLQAATQINEMTLSFVPKLLVIVAALFVAGHWMLGLLTDYTRDLFMRIPELIG